MTAQSMTLRGCSRSGGALVLRRPRLAIVWHGKGGTDPEHRVLVDVLIVGVEDLTHRLGFRMLWRRKSRSGRPPIPAGLRELNRQTARKNPGWVEHYNRGRPHMALGPGVPDPCRPSRCPWVPSVIASTRNTGSWRARS